MIQEKKWAAIAFVGFLVVGLASCGGGGSGGSSGDGVVVLDPSRSLNRADQQTELDAALVIDHRKRLIVGGQIFDEIIGGSAPSPGYFPFKGLASGQLLDFRVDFIAAGESAEQGLYYSLSGQHTFEPYVEPECGRESGDCERDGANKFRLALPLVTAEAHHYDCDSDGRTDLQERSAGDDHCALGLADADQALIVARPLSPDENGTVAISEDSQYEFSFSVANDTRHIGYRVDLRRAGESGEVASASLGAQTSTSHALAIDARLNAGGDYEWQVFGRRADGRESAISRAFAFSVASVAPQLSAQSPVPGAQLTRVPASTGYRFELDLSQTSGVSELRLYLFDDSNRIDYGYKRFNPASGTAQGTTRNLDLRAGARHRWWAVALDGNGREVARTSTRYFTIGSTARPPSLSLSSPIDGATVAFSGEGYVFSWSGTNTLAVSQWQVHVRDETVGRNWGHKNVPGDEARTVRNIQLGAGSQIRWWVTGMAADGSQLVQSAEQLFRVQAAAVNVVLAHQSPGSGAQVSLSSNGYDFAWSVGGDTDRVHSYRVHVFDDGNGKSAGYKIVEPDGREGVLSTRRNITLTAGGRTRWWVSAHDASGSELARTGESSFFIAGASRPAPTVELLGPASGASVPFSDSGYAFSWRGANAGAVAQWHVHVEGLDGGRDWGHKPVGGTVESTIRNIDLLSGETYRWWVAGVNAGGTELVRSAERRFTVASGGGGTATPAVTLTSPANGSQVVLSDSGYLFRWGFEDAGSVAQWHVHVVGVGADRDWGHKEVGGGVTSTTRGIRLVAGVTYRWWVEGVDAGRNAFARSEVRQFRVVSP